MSDRFSLPTPTVPLDSPAYRSVYLDVNANDHHIENQTQMLIMPSEPETYGIPERDVQRGTADCIICGAPQPAGHVPVRDSDEDDSEIIGRICSSHTFWEAIKSGKLTVELYRWDELVGEVAERDYPKARARALLNKVAEDAGSDLRL